jgi:hypothetical protein
MKNRIGSTALKSVAIWLSLGLGPLTAWSQMPTAITAPPSTSKWKIVKQEKHLTVRINPAATIPQASMVKLGAVTYTGSTKKLSSKDSAKVVSVLQTCLAKDLSTNAVLQTGSAAGTFKVNAEIRSVRRSHPLINAVAIAAVFVPVDLGAAKVTAWVIDENTGQAVAEIDLVGSGQIYQVLSSLQPLGQGKIVLKHESRLIAKEVALLRSEQQTPVSTTAAMNGR